MSVDSAHSGSEYTFMRSSIWIFIVVCLLSGCDFRKEAHMSPPSQQQDVQLIVFAAASLSDAFTEIAKSFENVHPGVNVTLHFAGSQQLAHQIRQGAPADVFASANEAQMHLAIASGRIEPGASTPFATNELAIALPKTNPARLQTYEDLSRPELLIVLADQAVPIGFYSHSFLEKASQNFNEAYKGNVLDNVVSFEQNVRAVLTKVSLGEADAGIVYSSDLLGLNSVTSLEIPSHLNVNAGYPIASLSDTQVPEAARAFVQFVHSSEGQQILQNYGLKPNVAL